MVVVLGALACNLYSNPYHYLVCYHPMVWSQIERFSVMEKYLKEK